MLNSTRHPAMSTALRLGLAGFATTGVLLQAPVAAEAQAAPIGSTAATTVTAPATAPAAAPVAAPATAPAVAPAKHKLTAREKAKLRKQRRAHRREVRERRIARRHHRHVVHRNHEIEHAFNIAARQTGDPYVWGATGPWSFDCSGLTSYAYHNAGLALPRTAAEQAMYVRHIPRSQLRHGDFIFFDGAGAGYVHHVALFDGWKHGRPIMLNAPHTGADVRREAIWDEHWFAGTLRLPRH